MDDPRPTLDDRPSDVYADLAAPIFRDIIAPGYAMEVRDLATWRRRWRKISNWVEGLAHVMLGAASILAFSAGFFDDKFLSYASACSSTICLAMLRFSAYASNESVERNAALTRLLGSVGLSPMPDLNVPPATSAAEPPGTVAGRGPGSSHRARPPRRPKKWRRAPAEAVPAGPTPGSGGEYPEPH